MPKKKIYTAIRGFNYVPEGKTDEVRVDVGDSAPADLTAKQVARLIERGILEGK